MAGEPVEKLEPLLSPPLAVTTTFPVVAPGGTTVAILVEDQLVTTAAVPLNPTEPTTALWLEPKFVPVMVTGLPTGPDVRERLVIFAVASTLKLDPLLFTPLANTTTFPVVAPEGTEVTILVALQLVMPAVVPLNLTV